MSKKTAKNKSDKFFVITTPIIISLIILIGACTWLLFFAPEKNMLTQIPGIKQTRQLLHQYPTVTRTPSPTTKPTITPEPIPHGPKGFSISGGKHNAPLFGRGRIDPYDPQQGETQTIIINIQSQSPVTNVQAILTTDHQENQIPMELVEGSETDGKWQGSWQVNDTYLHIYKLTIKATNSENTQEATLILR